MKRFILSILLLAVIIGIGQLINHITATQHENQDTTAPIFNNSTSSDTISAKRTFTNN